MTPEQRAAAAISFLTKAVEADPHDARALHDLAELQRHMGRLDAALESYDRAIQLLPESPEIHCGQANVLRKLGRLGAAVSSYDRAIALRPDFALAHSLRGTTLAAQGDLAAALESYDRALDVQPHYADALINRAFTLYQLGRPDLALASYDRALAIDPTAHVAHNNRGNLLRELDRPEEALASYDRAIAAKPDYAEAHSNRGIVLQQLLRMEDALASFETALHWRPSYASAHFNRAVALLLMGRLREGWLEHEWRWEVATLPGSRDRRNWSQPLWRGEASLAGRRILLHSEQGFGDTLQFCRYATLVARSGAQVILEVPRGLQSLMSGLEGVSSCVSRGDPLPSFDFHCPLLTLPLVCATTDLASIPAPTGYLRADPQRVEQWEHRLGATERLRVGIVWNGSRVNTNGRHRNVPLAELIAHLPIDVDYVALQKEITDDERTTLTATGAVRDVSGDIADFADTAALCECMDLVISVDTSVAHLAGALGRPVWILLSYSPDWRWLLQREDSPWYSSARLYRQQRRCDWTNPLQRLRADVLVVMAEAHLAKASTLLDLGRHADALARCESALAARPDMPGGHLNRGLALTLLGRRDDALECYQRAIELAPEHAPAYSDRALVLTELERPEEAVASCDRALALNPDLLGAHMNRGMALKWLGRPREALESFGAALRLVPECAEAHWNAALCHLQLGEFAQGWQEHEWRKRMREPLGARRLPCPAWLGDERLQGKTLFLHSEQGLGDNLQFCRYAKLAQRQGARVILSVPAPLRELMASLDPNVQLIDDTDSPPAADFHCALLSMPFAMRTQLDSIPEIGRYLGTNPERVRGWRSRLGTTGLKVGIRWQGRSGIRADIGRSPPLAAFAPLAAIPGVRLISLQKGPGLEQLREFAGAAAVEVVLDDDEGPGSFADTAALIDCLDLVITSDTSIAHLAGALGRPTWVALKFSADWRWLLHRTDTPWYRGMRLFRQSRAGDWQSVFDAMGELLSTSVHSSSGD